MPLVDVFTDPRVKATELRQIADVLRDVVPRAVQCAEEPIVGPLAIGDLEIRFRSRGPADVGELAVLVEVRTKKLDGRLHDAQARADLICSELSRLDVGPIGVWLMLLDGAWSQTD